MAGTIDALNGGGKRTKVHDAQIIAKVPQAAKDLVEKVAKKEEVTAATIVRWALGEYFERRGYRI